MSAIGEFRERISLQQEVRLGDGGGGVLLNWEEVAELWAAVEPLSGRETIQGEKVTALQTYRVRFRCEEYVRTSMRIVWQERVLNIRNIRHVDARGRLLEIIAEEGVAT
jgi:SPP1 family predicted phage head-tail adaptor